jgi:hypothetical protein
MGFHVRPGGAFPDGVANRVVSFIDESYIELLYFTKPKQELTGEALSEYRFTESSGGGANSFALTVDDVDATRSFLIERGLAVGDADALSYDPDGDGPKPPIANLWRTVKLQDRALASSELFFIRYHSPPRSPEGASDAAARAAHPNTAIRLSAVWLLSEDIAADQARLKRMGFAISNSVHSEPLNASGVRLDLAGDAVILLEPDGPGPAARAVAARGPHVHGISVAVSDLGRAQRIIERGFGQAVTRYRGLMGDAVNAPSFSEIGLWVEFHQSK